MNHIFLIRQFVKYWFNAKTAHGIHSPFVFDFIKNVLQDHRHFYAFDEIAQLRKDLYANQTMLNVEDFGAGSLVSNFKQRKICDIAKTAGRNQKFGKLLFRILNYYESKHVLELGTSLGIGTSYMAKSNANIHLHTIEGSGEIAQQARLNFKQLHLQNITQHVGNFDHILDSVLKNMPSPDVVFIDGNHREEPTVNYFLACIPHLHEDSIVIFDDIHWSEGMLAAWKKIQSHNAVTLSLDLFYFGIVFFRKEFKTKQHFTLKF